MKPVDPAVGKMVAQAWANYQVFAERDRAQRLQAMTDDDTRREVAQLFNSDLEIEPKPLSGLIEMQRIFRRAREC